MPPRVIFLAGSPDMCQLAKDHRGLRDELLPEFQNENLSLRRFLGPTTGQQGQARWAQVSDQAWPEHPDSTVHVEPRSLAAGSLNQDLDGLDNRIGGAIPVTIAGEEQMADHELEKSLELSLRYDSFETMSSIPESQHPDINAHIREMSRLDITDLSQVPSAAYLRSIEPRTMTVNLLVGIVEDPRWRTIVTRARRQRLTLVEIKVGDCSHSGFGINLWLGVGGGQNSPYFEVSRALRRGQVVIFRNVACSSFRERVHGQNVRGTKIAIVHRSCRGTQLDAVTQWTVEHVPTFASMIDEDATYGQYEKATLPMDTQ